MELWEVQDGHQDPEPPPAEPPVGPQLLVPESEVDHIDVDEDVRHGGPEAGGVVETHPEGLTDVDPIVEPRHPSLAVRPDVGTERSDLVRGR